MTPEEVNDLNATLSQLQSLLGFSDDVLQQFEQNLKSQRRFNNVPLLDNVSETDLAIFAAHQHKFPGCPEARLIRSYPYADLLTHAVGLRRKN